MRIMVFMTNHGGASNFSFLSKVLTPALYPHSYRARGRCWILCLVASSWIAVSTHATANLLNSHTRPESLTMLTSPLSILPRLEAFYPVLSLLAAVASTYILRRRHVAQLEAIAAAER